MSTKKNKKFDGFIVEQVEFQLDKIVSSSGFKHSIQMQNFLQYIIHKRLSSQERQLKQYTIAVEALGQDEGFDADANPLVRIEAGRLRKKLDYYYQNEGRHDLCLITMPVGRYAPLFEKNKAVDTTSPDTILQNNWDKSMGPRLLVSCFTDKHQGDEGSKLLYYVTDNLSRVLSHFLFIRLISAVPHAEKEFSSSVISSYRENDKTDYILTIYIHHIQANNYKLICQLIEAKTQEILWSENYAVNKDEIDSQQGSICNKVAAAVADLQQGVMHVHWARQLLQNDKEDIDDHYKVTVYYRLHADNFVNESFAKAVEACQQAIKRNSQDVIALVVFSEYCRREYVYSHGVIENPLKKGLASAQEAVRLKPESHEAHYVLGQIWYHLENEPLCILEFEESRRLSRHNALITFGTGFHLFLMEKWEEGMALVDNVMGSGSAFPDWFHMIPYLNYYRQEQYDEALIEAHRIISPGSFWGPLARATVYGQLNQQDKAKVELLELIKRYPDFENIGILMLKRYLGSNVLFDCVYEGLSKAGIEALYLEK